MSNKSLLGFPKAPKHPSSTSMAVLAHWAEAVCPHLVPTKAKKLRQGQHRPPACSLPRSLSRVSIRHSLSARWIHHHSRRAPGTQPGAQAGAAGGALWTTQGGRQGRQLTHSSRTASRPRSARRCQHWSRRAARLQERERQRH